MRNIVALACLVALVGCAPRATVEMSEFVPPAQESRVKVQRIGVFRDDAAYNNTRAIYVITDSKTGQEFIGISGVGIAETGSHPAGKTISRDER